MKVLLFLDLRKKEEQEELESYLQKTKIEFKSGKGVVFFETDKNKVEVDKYIRKLKKHFSIQSYNFLGVSPEPKKGRQSKRRKYND